LRAGTQIERIVILHGTHGGIIEGIESAAREKHIRLQEVDKDQFQQIAGDEHAQGVAAIIGKRKQATLEEIIARGKAKNEKGLILLLDEIEDPHNLGALIRTAECSGFHGVVVPRHHAAPITNTVVKTSAGATEHLPIAEETNLVQVIGDLKKEGFWVVGLDMEGTTNYTETDFSSPTALVVGSERKGIRRLVREHCDVLVKIPLHGNIDSLNASVAGALVMFEARKSRAVS
jgi:23S rRNA (guanosine2251-2'-O)-methyltransferase